MRPNLRPGWSRAPGRVSSASGGLTLPGRPEVRPPWGGWTGRAGPSRWLTLAGRIWRGRHHAQLGVVAHACHPGPEEEQVDQDQQRLHNVFKSANIH